MCAWKGTRTLSKNLPKRNVFIRFWWCLKTDGEKFLTAKYQIVSGIFANTNLLLNWQTCSTINIQGILWNGHHTLLVTNHCNNFQPPHTFSARSRIVKGSVTRFLLHVWALKVSGSKQVLLDFLWITSITNFNDFFLIINLTGSYNANQCRFCFL